MLSHQMRMLSTKGEEMEACMKVKKAEEVTKCDPTFEAPKKGAGARRHAPVLHGIYADHPFKQRSKKLNSSLNYKYTTQPSSDAEWKEPGGREGAVEHKEPGEAAGSSSGAQELRSSGAQELTQFSVLRPSVDLAARRLDFTSGSSPAC
ncbi:hypothetical protein CYMTET_29492 [Cymbomonas tetramitiformis]|uniref:Uncharacterized protein n=1 Tax=Cymbomonas tetramitiformis TaxID=36881 RepID=A0AAE0FKW8_9CHLO|nr:hypothetical protein CYMTET_29492 [Cymbomonas tetramitiformis]